MTSVTSEYITVTTALTSMKQIWKVQRQKDVTKGFKTTTTRRLLYIFDSWQTAVAYGEAKSNELKLPLTYSADIKLPFNKESFNHV